jgi:hypothetical protein
MLSSCATTNDVSIIRVLHQRILNLEEKISILEQSTNLNYVTKTQPMFESHIFKVPNSNGSVTSINIIYNGQYYIGPKNEQYTSIPTQRQIERLYRQ